MKAWLVGRRELGDLFSDRSYLFGLLALLAIPVILVSTVPTGLNGRGAGPLILIFAIQATVFPAFMSVNAAASAFIQDKENQSLLPLLAAPIRDEQIVFGKAIAVFAPSILASWLALVLYIAVASYRFGLEAVFETLTLQMIFSLAVLAALLTMTVGSVGMIIASRVRTVRSAQQIAGLVIALVFAGVAVGAQYVARFADGWLIVAIPLGVLGFDIFALELTRRLWGREETIARI
jgi:ABC-type Na+ efflux pump permease subunit